MNTEDETREANLFKAKDVRLLIEQAKAERRRCEARANYLSGQIQILSALLRTLSEGVKEE